MRDFNYYKNLSADMIRADRERNLKYEWMEKVDHIEWEPDKKLSKLPWFHALPSKGPHDALNAGARTLSSVVPRPTFMPLDNEPNSRERAAVIEKVLMWHYMQASKRSVNNVTWDFVMSALRYDEVCAQVVYLPWQEKLAGKTKKLWGSGGDFSINVHNPRCVHTMRTMYGVEAVLLTKNVLAKEVVRTWGDYAKGLQERIEEDELEYVTLYDFTDGEARVVWCAPGQNDAVTPVTDHGSGALIDIYKEANDLPFMPWVSRSGGSNLEEYNEYKSRPLLDPIYKSNEWETSNLVGSLIVSLAVAHVAFPRTKSVTLDGETPEIDYDQPGGNVPLRQGEDVNPMQPPPMDENISTIFNQLESSMGSSTVPKILQDPNVPSGAAFASINTILKQASTVLDPYKGLAENALGDVYTQMLYWLIHTGNDLVAYDTTRKNMGGQLVIKSDEIDPDNVYITVKLTSSVAIDEVSKLNSGMLMRQLEIPKAKVYEDLGYTDPDGLVEEWTFDQYVQAEVNKTLAVKQAEAEAQAMAITGKVQMEMQNQQLAQQMQAQQQPAPGAGQVAMAEQQAQMRAAAGMSPDEQMQALGGMTEAAQGELGFNPAMGGTPPAMLAPEVTREAVTNRDRTGQLISGR